MSQAAVTRPNGPLVAVLPRAGDPAPFLAGFPFLAGKPPEGTPGIFVLTRQVGDTAYPLFVGEAEDVAAAVRAFQTSDPDASEADGCLWAARAQARQRAHIARDIVGKFHPPLNAEHRKGPAAPEIASLVGDRFAGQSGAAPAVPPGGVEATEEELARLVEAFYAAARHDPLIGPVFDRSVADWDEHARVVRDFWSRAMLGTRRYNGTPFTPHLSLRLRPEHFERWIALFKETAAAVLRPAAAAFAVAKVEHMAKCFQTGLFLPDAG